MKAGSQVKADNTHKGACLDLKPKVKHSELLETILKQTTIRYLKNVLIEENNMKGTCSGTTGNHLKVIVPIDNHSRGSLITVRIQSIQEGKLIGIPIFCHN